MNLDDDTPQEAPKPKEVNTGVQSWVYNSQADGDQYQEAEPTEEETEKQDSSIVGI